MRFDFHILRLSICALALLAVTFSIGCSRQEESISGSANTQPAKPGEVKTFETLSASQTKGVSVVAKTSSGIEPQILTAVRTGDQPGMDRIVFEFNDAGLPEWEVKYVERPFIIDCGSGEAVSVAGNAWLQITFRGAQAHTAAGEATSGPRRRMVNQSVVRELIRTCDFEGEVTWVAAMARESEYIPRVLAAPSRLVIDIAH